MDQLLPNPLLASMPPVWRQARLRSFTLQEGQQWPLSVQEAWFPGTALLGLRAGPDHAGLPAVVGCTGWVPPAERLDSPLQVCVLRAGEAYRCDWAWDAPDTTVQAAVWLACAGATAALHQQWARRAHSQQHQDLARGLASWWLDCEQAGPASESLVWSETVLLAWLGCLPSVLSRALHVLREQGALERAAQGWRCADRGRLSALAGDPTDRGDLQRAATQASASASATLMPSTPADKIPPA